MTSPDELRLAKEALSTVKLFARRTNPRAGITALSVILALAPVSVMFQPDRFTALDALLKISTHSESGLWAPFGITSLMRISADDAAQSITKNNATENRVETTRTRITEPPNSLTIRSNKKLYLKVSARFFKILLPFPWAFAYHNLRPDIDDGEQNQDIANHQGGLCGFCAQEPHFG